jgi:hypothetical protein
MRSNFDDTPGDDAQLGYSERRAANFEGHCLAAIRIRLALRGTSRGRPAEAPSLAQV